MKKNLKQKTSKDLKIDVHYLTRVEGHGNIIVDVKKGKLTKCEFQVVESPRFFESMLVDRSIWEAQHITSRICGICACGHSLASIKAGEDALGITPSDETILLRKLLLYTEQLDSHILHIYVLVAPDLLGAKSVFPLIKTHKAVIERALRMKRMSDFAGEVLAGRHVHPITYVIGGLTKMPSKEKLEKLYEMMIATRVDLDETVKLISSLKFPEFERPTQYLSLSNDEEYAMYDGDLIVTSKDKKKEKINPLNYIGHIKEKVMNYSNAKFSEINNRPYAVGALARFNNNSKKLNKKGKETAEILGLEPPLYNPYLNTLAQLVEYAHFLEEAISIVARLIKNGINEDKVLVSSWPKRYELNKKYRGGVGIGCVEVPRGSLFHEYTIDEAGRIEKANCIIPTNQNLGNLEEDMRHLVPKLIGKKKEDDIRLDLEMLARAYDPCISCATHIVDVKFIK